MRQLRVGVLLVIASAALESEACTFGPGDELAPDGGGSGTGGTVNDSSTSGGGAGGKRSTGGATADGGNGAGVGSGGTSSGVSGAGGSESGGASSGGTPNAGGASNSGGTPGTGGSLVDSGAPDADGATDGSSDASACGRCPSGQYCDTVTVVCRAGCAGNSACASGSCGVTHDCDRCVSDAECADGRVCSTGQCLPTCATSQDCPSGFDCCGNRCADIVRDFHHCGSCTADCTADDYCSSLGCRSLSVAASCDTPHMTFVLDGASVDDALTPVVKDALVSLCPSTPTTSVDPETASAALNPVTGQPVSGAGDTVVELGGPYSQKVAHFVEAAGFTRVYDTGDSAKIGFYRHAADGGPDPAVVEAPMSTLTATHDYFKIELAVDPISGTRLLQIYGLLAPGTSAAEWFFLNRVLPKLSTFTLRYYVYEWTHGDAGALPGAGDSFVLLASGN